MKEHCGLLNVAASWDMIADSLSLNEIVCTEIKTHKDQGIAFCIYNSSSFITAILSKEYNEITLLLLTINFQRN